MEQKRVKVKRFKREQSKVQKVRKLNQKFRNNFKKQKKKH